MNNNGFSKNTLADSVESRLLDYLHQARLDIGDFLPKETELADKLHVSRNIVREGLSRLKALGILEPKKHCGTVLCRPKPFAGFTKLAQANLFTVDEQRNFMELRIAMELGMCEFIYLRRTPEKIKALRKIARNASASALQYSVEVNFHAQLMAFADNPAVCDFREVLVTAFGAIPKKAQTDFVTPSHADICDVLESGDISDFQTIMRQHFMPYYIKH